MKFFVSRKNFEQVKRANEMLGEELARARGELSKAIVERQKAVHGVAEMNAERAAWREKAEQLQGQLEAAGVLTRMESMPVTKAELIEALKVVTSSTPLWRAVHALLLDQKRIAVEAVCEVGLSDEDAQYRRGWLAAVDDTQRALLTHHAEAQKEEG